MREFVLHILERGPHRHFQITFFRAVRATADGLRRFPLCLGNLSLYPYLNNARQACQDRPLPTSHPILSAHNNGSPAIVGSPIEAINDPLADLANGW